MFLSQIQRSTEDIMHTPEPPPVAPAKPVRHRRLSKSRFFGALISLSAVALVALQGSQNLGISPRWKEIIGIGVVLANTAAALIFNPNKRVGS